MRNTISDDSLDGNGMIGRREVIGSAISVVGAGAILGTSAQASQQPPAPRTANVAPPTPAEAELLKLSREKWALMSDKKADDLAKLFHEKAIFVHMGGSMTRDQELGVIRSGGIHYKTFDIKRTYVSVTTNGFVTSLPPTTAINVMVVRTIPVASIILADARLISNVL